MINKGVECLSASTPWAGFDKHQGATNHVLERRRAGAVHAVHLDAVAVDVERGHRAHPRLDLHEQDGADQAENPHEGADEAAHCIPGAARVDGGVDGTV